MARKKTIEVKEQTAKAEAPAPAPSSTRITYHITPELAEKIRDIAWWDRKTVNHLVQTALEEFVHKLETERGKPYPRRSGILRRGKPLA